jgi:hypothetical protein
VLTARTGLTNRMLIFGKRHLRTVLAEYSAHYNGRPPHRALHLLPPGYASANGTARCARSDDSASP